VNKKLTIKEKEIASGFYGYGIDKKDYYKIKKKARSHYWYDKKEEAFIAISPTGRRIQIYVILYSWARKKIKDKWFKLGKQKAKYWARGQYNKSKEVPEVIWEKY